MFNLCGEADFLWFCRTNWRKITNTHQLMTSSLLLWMEKMRLSAAILCAFLSFSFIAAPTVEAAQKKPAAVKVVKKKAVKKTVVEKTAKKKVVAVAATAQIKVHVKSGKKVPAIRPCKTSPKLEKPTQSKSDLGAG